LIRAQILERLSEPSTYAGLSVLAALFGVSTEEWQTYVMAVSGVFAVVAMLLREGAKKPAEEDSEDLPPWDMERPHPPPGSRNPAER